MNLLEIQHNPLKLPAQKIIFGKVADPSMHPANLLENKGLTTTLRRNMTFDAIFDVFYTPCKYQKTLKNNFIDEKKYV